MSYEQATIPIEVVCGCSDRPRRVPLRVTIDAVDFFRDTLSTIVDKDALQDMPVLTWRCGKCKQITSITVRQLHLLRQR